jgi:hypothetical protein
MAHYAELDETLTVIQIFVGQDENHLTDEVKDWEQYYARPGFTVKRTSFNTHGGIYYDPMTGQPAVDQTKAFRKNYAGIGFAYSEQLDAFIPPKPFDSWSLNEETCLWVAPKPHPNDGFTYIWDELELDWVLANFADSSGELEA